MLRYVTGNIFTAPAEAIINPVNCVGAMGKGLALAFKLRFPEVFSIYHTACKRREVKIGTMHICQVEDWSRKPNGRPHYVINFPTKIHWRDRSRLGYVDVGLKALKNTIIELGLRSIAIPKLGCGNGGLDWTTVKGLIESNLAGLDETDILIYE